MNFTKFTDGRTYGRKKVTSKYSFCVTAQDQKKYNVEEYLKRVISQKSLRTTDSNTYIILVIHTNYIHSQRHAFELNEVILTKLGMKSSSY